LWVIQRRLMIVTELFVHISIKVLHNLLEITKCMQKISANANDIFVKQEPKWIFHNLLNTHAHEQTMIVYFTVIDSGNNLTT
jgi:hypothetical protein